MERKTAALVLSLVLTLTGCGSTEPSPEATAAPVIADETVYTDGTYSGKGIGFGGPVLVTVTVEGGKVAAIQVDEHQDGKIGNRVYPDLIQAMVAANTSAVDSVSGATVSSGGIKEAVRNALRQAK